MSPVDFTYVVLTARPHCRRAVGEQPMLATYYRPMAQDIQDDQDIFRFNRVAWPRTECRL